MKLIAADLCKTQLLINGVWCDSASKLVVTNPATTEPLAQVCSASLQQVQQAVAAAAQAQPGWQRLGAATRAAVLHRWWALVLEHQQDLAQILSAEQGKPAAEALAEIQYAASFIQWFAEEARRVNGDIQPSPVPNRQLLTLKQPVGVVAAITPWNFPAAMVTRKVAPALAAGCTVVLKPSELTPLTALALAELAQRAGVAPGVLNVVPTLDTAAVGEWLCQSPQVQKLTFTGSTRVGKLLYRQCADTVKRLSLELGGNAPALVFADADLALAVRAVMAAKFRNTGQTCICINRILVEQSILPQFIALLTAEMLKLTQGPATMPGVQLGPLINLAAVARVHQLVQQAVAEGATLHCGGTLSDLGPQFYPATLLTEVHPGMALTQQEIFGPVAAIQSFSTEAEALALANNSRVGLAAYLFTRDPARIWRLGEQLQVGMVGINEAAISSELIPFGGVKESGLGREGSAYGIDEYLQLKHLCWSY